MTSANVTFTPVTTYKTSILNAIFQLIHLALFEFGRMKPLCSVFNFISFWKLLNSYFNGIECVYFFVLYLNNNLFSLLPNIYVLLQTFLWYIRESNQCSITPCILILELFYNYLYSDCFLNQLWISLSECKNPLIWLVFCAIFINYHFINSSAIILCAISLSKFSRKNINTVTNNSVACSIH